MRGIRLLLPLVFFINTLRTQTSTWSSVGPYNTPGRTPCILVDKRDTTGNTIYAGSSGGIWKSYNKGNNWIRLSHNDWTYVSCLAQDANGRIVFGTGDPYPAMLVENRGNGLYYLDNSDIPVHFPNTTSIANGYPSTNWQIIRKVACHPYIAQKMLAATLGKLMVSNDAGLSWADAGTKPGTYYDVEYSKNGDIAIATASGAIVRWESASSTWASLDSTSGLPSFALTGSGRKELSFSPTFNHIVYLSVSTNQGYFYGLYRSNDSGQHWQLLPSPSVNFYPFGTSAEGWYSQDVMVSPSDTNTIYLASDKFYCWQALGGWNECANAVYIPSIGSLHEVSENIHVIAFNPYNPGEMYIGTDRGIYFTSSADNNPIYPDFYPKNLDLQTALLTDGCSTHDGNLFSSGIDHGIAISECSNQSSLTYFHPYIGSGVAESFLLPSVSYYHTYQGNLYKSIDNKASYICTYDYKADPVGSCEVSRCLGQSGNNHPYDARFFLAETKSAFNSTDSVSYTVPYDMYANDGVIINSNVQNLPFSYEFSSYTPAGTLIRLPDPIKSRIYMTSNCGVWMSPDALKPTYQMKWYKLSNINFTGTTKAFDQSHDGDTLYIGTSQGRIYRFVGLNQIAQYNYASGDTLNPVLDSSTVTSTIISSKSITGISVASNQSGVILCSLGDQYSATVQSYVYKSNNAGLTWSSTQTNLPRMPVYDCMIDFKNNNHYLLATEKGFYESWDAGISWQEANDGFSRTPVTRLRQIREGCDTCYSTYASTYGRGIWKLNDGLQSWCNSVSSVDNEAPNWIRSIKIYPNPTFGNTSIDVSTYPGAATVYIYDLSGRLVLSKTIQGKDEISLTSGVYFVRAVWSDNNTAGQKLIVIN